MKIVITGKNGYIANNLLNYFNKMGENAVSVSFRNGSDGVDLFGVEAVVHCAAIVHKKESSYADQYDKINHIEAVKLARRAKNEGAGHFVFISTMSVYGLKNGVIDKNTLCNPITLYGKSKLAAEKEILALQDDSFKVIVLRPPMVYGKNCPGNFGQLKRLAAITPVFPKVNNKRSMIYIENLTAAIYNIIKNNACGIVLPMDKEYVNTSVMVKNIGGLMGKRILLSRLLGVIAEFMPLSLFKKVFGSLYYESNEAMLCDYIDFDTALKRSV